MKVIRTVSTMKALAREWRREGKRIGFVPTMGYLHEGHLSLVRESKGRADVTVVSIFVNPTQFGVNEDFDKYPRTLAADSALLAEAHCDLLFVPDTREMYPDGHSQPTSVSVEGITGFLCGASRPGHFTGVATVVSKLFNIVQPDMAFFGEKDYQQLAAKTLSARRAEVAGFPLATIAADKPLPLLSGVNPAWRDKIETLRMQVVQPLQDLADDLHHVPQRQAGQHLSVDHGSLAGPEK